MEAKHTPMVVAAAREMCRLSSEACGIDNGDNWKIYGPAYLEEAKAVLAACGVAELLEALNGLLRHVDRETCQHDETYRGGAIWTICRQCDMKWADDLGGFKPHKDSPEVAAARAAISRATGEQDTGRADGARVPAKPSDCTPNSYCADMSAGRPCACFPAHQTPDGFMEAFYEMAAMLGVEGAQAKSPEQVYREQVKPALERLQQRASDAEAAYLNMRQWAEQNGVDTTARNAGVEPSFADQPPDCAAPDCDCEPGIECAARGAARVVKIAGPEATLEQAMDAVADMHAAGVEGRAK